MSIIENNNVVLTGEIVSEIKLDHEIMGKKFYAMEISVARFSGTVDIIPLNISEDMIDINGDYRGQHVSITGNYRSYNFNENGKMRLKLGVFVRTIEFIEEESIYRDINNVINLTGFICRDVVCRKTLATNIDIADILLAVNRPYGKSDYIPCICWNNVAVYASSLKVGDEITISGRIQSRNYIKNLSDTEEKFQLRTAYEVSIQELELISE